MIRRIFPLALFGVAGVALAGGWEDYGPAFPGLPCNDGWASCIVEGTVVSPGMVLDDAGRPHPADWRFGFFDFDALPSMSPFEGLSSYTGEVEEGSRKSVGDKRGDAVADAGPTPDRAAQASVEALEAAREAQAARVEAEAARVEAKAAADARAAEERDARAAAEAARRAASDSSADAATRQRAEAAARAAEETARKAEAARRAADEAAAKRATEEAAANKAAQEAEARRAADELATRRAAEEEAARRAQSSSATADASTTSAAKPLSPSDASSGDCSDLIALEAPSMMGQLGVGRRKCLEGRLGSSSVQTEKSKISRVLINDAQARGDRADWERLMKRHLEDIDRSDPNLCFTYAIHLAKGGAGRANGVIRWADYALENKQQWSGNTYKKNVYNLLKLKAQAANKLWQSAETKFVEDRSDENEAKAARYRGQAKDFAREWLDYARASGQNTSSPLALCVSAAGNKEFCEG